MGTGRTLGTGDGRSSAGLPGRADSASVPGMNTPLAPEIPTKLAPEIPTKSPKPFLPWVWWPLGILILGFAGEFASAFIFKSFLFEASFALIVGTTVYFFVQCLGRLFLRQWNPAGVALLRLGFLIPVGLFAFCMCAFFHMFGPSEDHFADNLKMPAGIEIAEPIEPGKFARDGELDGEPAEYEKVIRAAMATPGGNDPEIVTAIPSLRRASTEFPKQFREYIESAPEWGGFTESGNRFSARLWRSRGEYQRTLHGYISEFNGKAGFQTRCLLCLDRKQWGGRTVQTVPEGKTPVTPKMSVGNDLDESQVLIDCGGVQVEIFEQSRARERRVTKATILLLENEFSKFIENPEAAVALARAKAREIALATAAKDGSALVLLNGMQPGMYGAKFSRNPGEPGSVYLKAFEVTQGTALSERSVAFASETRILWSKHTEERFGAESGFTIYEGDWGKPYAARVEVWFKPDSGVPERKLAERVFKIEGWMR